MIEKLVITFLEFLILSVLAIVISLLLMGLILFLRNICNLFNRRRGAKIKEVLTERLSDSGYRIEYIDEFGLARLEDVFYNMVMIYKGDELFLRYDFNPTRFYFSKKEILIEYILTLINRHENKNVLLLKELLNSVSVEYFQERVIHCLNRDLIDWTISYHLLENHSNLKDGEFDKLIPKYIEKIAPVYVDVYKKLYINAEKDNYKILRRFDITKDYSDFKNFNFKIVLDTVLPEDNDELVEEYSNYLYELIDNIFIKNEIDDIISSLDESILRELIKK